MINDDHLILRMKTVEQDNNPCDSQRTWRVCKLSMRIRKLSQVDLVRLKRWWMVAGYVPTEKLPMEGLFRSLLSLSEVSLCRFPLCSAKATMERNDMDSEVSSFRSRDDFRALAAYVAYRIALGARGHVKAMLSMGISELSVFSDHCFLSPLLYLCCNGDLTSLHLPRTPRCELCSRIALRHQVATPTATSRRWTQASDGSFSK